MWYRVRTGGLTQEDQCVQVEEEEFEFHVLILGYMVSGCVCLWLFVGEFFLFSPCRFC